jgi:spermidine synthase
LTYSRQSSDWFETIHRDPKEHPYIVDEDGTKTLHFDARCEQSCMSIEDPNALMYGYTRAMMGFLLFQPAPRDILIVGLGGGSLSKYCYHTLPDSVVTTVEISAAVIALRNEFLIPPDDARFQIVQADAALYLQQQHAVADVILLDGYEPYGLPDALSTQAFYDRCFEALRPGGVLAANLWGSDSRLSTVRAYLRRAFDHRLLRANSDTGDNQIAFGLKQVALPVWEGLENRARHWQEETGLNFTSLLSQLWRSARSKTGENWLADAKGT